MKKISLILLLILLITTIYAETISLQESIDLARKQNKMLVSSDNLEQAAKWQKRNAITQFLPHASFNERWLRLEEDQVMSIPVLGDMILQKKNNYTSEISVNQPLFASGKLYLNYKIADLSLKQASNQNALKVKELDWQTAGLYFQILKLNEINKISQKTVDSYQSHYEKAQIKREQGIGLLTELLQWKVKYETAQSDLASLSNSFAVLLDSWYQHLGIVNDGKELMPVEINLDEVKQNAQLIADLSAEQKTEQLNAFLESFMQTNRNKQNLAISKDMLDYQIKFAKTEFLPTLGLNFTYQFDNDDKLNLKGADNWTLVAMFSVPLFYSGSNYTQYKTQYYKTKQQIDELDNIDEMLAIQAKKTYLDYYDLALKIKTNTINLELAQENINQVTELVNQGMLTYSDLMDAEIMLQSVTMSYYSDLYDFMIKEYELKLFREE